MFCSKCGTQIKDGEKFCPTCGTPAAASEKIKAAAEEVFVSAEKELNSAIGEVENSISNAGKSNNNAANSSAATASASSDTDSQSTNSSNNAVSATTGDNNGENNMNSGAVRLKDDRGIVSFILLDLITCGIYGLYFVYKMAEELNIACDGDGEQTPGLLPFILLSIVTCGFYAYYWYYKVGNRLSANAARYGLSFQENGTTVLLWCVVGLVLCGIGPWIGMYILIKNSNQICAAYNRQNGLQ